MTKKAQKVWEDARNEFEAAIEHLSDADYLEVCDEMAAHARMAAEAKREETEE